MSTLHVRNVPEALYERLRQRAAEQRRSLSAEVVILLSQALSQEQSASATLEEIRRGRAYSPSAVGAPDSTRLLREDRER
ncbi:MAG: Arc family DNA-binding protein [Anaerolineae bacterium]